MSEKLRGPRDVSMRKWTAANVSDDRRQRLLELGVADDPEQLAESLKNFERIVDLLPRGSVRFREMPSQKYREFAILTQGPEESDKIVELIESLGLMPWYSNDFVANEIVISHPSDILILEQLGLTDMYETEQYAPRKRTGEPEVLKALREEAEKAAPDEPSNLVLKKSPYDTYPEPRSKAQMQSITPPAEEMRKVRAQRENDAAKNAGEMEIMEMDQELRETVDRFDLGLTEEDSEYIRAATANTPSLKLFPRKYIWKSEERKLYRARTGTEVTSGQQHRLNMLAKNDDRALKECVDMNVGLVVWCLPAMQRKYPNADSDDLFQAGLIGLMKVLRKYGSNEAVDERDKIEVAAKERRRKNKAGDENKVRRGWTSYMIYYIENEMRREGMNATSVVQRGTRGLEKRRAYFKGLSALRAAFPDRAIRRDELRATLHDLGLIKKSTDIALDKFERAYWLTGVFAHDEPAILDANASEHSVDLQGNPMAESTNIDSSDERRRIVSKALSTLTPREERILRLRFGILGGIAYNDDKTLEELAESMNVSRERIRQIESKALRKLKHPSRSRRLRAVFDGSLPKEMKS